MNFMLAKRSAILLLSCAALSGCAVQLYGNQSTGGGASATTTSSHVVASTTTSNAKLGFSYGQPVSPAAPGGQVSAGGGSLAAVVLVTAVVVEVLNALGGVESAVKPLPPDTRLSHTCSCYGYKPGDR